MPKNGNILVVCAKGDSSDYVASLLRTQDYRAASLKGGMIAWGDYHHATPVPTAGPGAAAGVFYQINRAGKGCLSYLIGSGGEAMVVDPSRHIEEYIRLSERHGLRISHVFDTHLHADHISGGPLLAQRAGATYHISEADASAAQFPFQPLKDGEDFRVGDLGVTAIATASPGHTPGSFTFLINGEALLSGDTIFVSSVGRPDLGGQAEPWAKDLYHTLLTRLGKLPEDTLVLPAHYSSPEESGQGGIVAARLGELRRNNPALQASNEEEFVRTILGSLGEQPEVYSDIRKANLGHFQAGEEKMTEMELGKNLCAAAPATPMETAQERPRARKEPAAPSEKVLDVEGAQCPVPIIRARQAVSALEPGQVLKVVATDAGSVADFKGWAAASQGVRLLRQETEELADGGARYLHYLQRIALEEAPVPSAGPQGPQAASEYASQLELRVAALERQLAEIKSELPDKRVSLVVFSGDLDKVLSSFVIATGAAAMNMEVSMFFTFWGLSALKRRVDYGGKSLPERLMSLMSPVGTQAMGVSKMNFFGVGARILRSMMKRKQVASLEELMQEARAMGVKIIACQMSMDVMGIRREELVEGLEVGGVATFLSDASRSKVSLFI